MVSGKADSNMQKRKKERKKLEYSPTPYTKINLKWIKDPNVRFVFSCEHISRCFPMLEDNIARILFDINYSNIFWIHFLE